jgi:hypothetical protein
MRLAEGRGSRFEAALAELSRRLAADIDPDGPRVSLILADADPRLVFARQRNDRDRLAGLYDELAATDTAADWQSVRRLIDSVRLPDERTEIVVLTDGADPAAAGIGGTEALVGGPVPAAALAVTLSEVAGELPNRFRLKGTASLAGTESGNSLIVSFDSPDAPEPLELARIALAAAEGGAAPIDTELTIPGAGVLSARLADKAWPGLGEARFAILAAPDPVAILVIGGPDPALLRGLSALPLVAVKQAAALPEDLSGIDLVVLDNAVVPRVPETNTLWVGRARLIGEADPGWLAPGEITTWRPEHPLSRGIVWRSLKLERASQLAPWPDGEAIVRAGDIVLVEARPGAGGRQVRIAADPARGWGEETSFPQFLGNLVAWLGPASSSRVAPACIAGRVCPLDARWYGGTIERLAGDRVGAPAEARIALPDPQGRFVPERSGLYRKGGALLAVNAGPGEAGEPAPAAPGPAPAEPLRLWPFLVAGVALLLLAEAWVAIRRRSAPRWLPASRAVTLALFGAALVNLPGPVLDPGQRVVAISAPPAEADGPAAALDARLGGEREAAAAAWVTLGETATVAADFGAPVRAPALVGGDEASAADAVRLAAALLPRDMPGRLVLATPAGFTASDLAALGPDLKRRGVTLDFARPAPIPAGEVAVAEPSVPPVILANDSFPLNGVLRAGAAGPAHVSLLAGGIAVAERDLDLVAGDNPVEFNVPRAPAEQTLYEIAVSAPGDVYPQNNRDGVLVLAAPPPRVLVLSVDAAAGRTFADGLAASGIEPRVLVPTAAPWLIEDWLRYDGYVLLDVPSLSLKTTQQNLLEAAVAEHGRPLLMLGGPHSFGPGGYLQTTLDRLSPLSSRVPKPAPEAAMVFVIDRSGSMAQLVDDVDRLEIAKQATLSAIELLNPESRVGIIAFDTVPHEIVPLTPASRGAAIAGALRQVGPGGGTELRPALEAALALLADVDAPVKHIVALTDGLTPQADFSGIIGEMTKANISISTIAIGTDANDRVLRGIAQAGRGVFHGSTDFKALPSIMTQETMLLSDSAIEETSTVPQWRLPRSDFLATLPDRLPAIEGYVLTTEKPDAKTDLTIRTRDGGEAPLLASWQYGSGRVLALATQGNGPWTAGLASLPGYGDLWPEVLRDFVSGAERAGLTLHAVRTGDTVFVSVGALDDRRGPLSGLDLALGATRTDGPNAADTPPRRLLMRETQPGLYEASLVLPAAGDYRLEASAGTQSASARLHLGYPARFSFSPDSSGEVLARLSGGRVIASGAPLLAEAGRPVLALAPNWLFWAGLAVLVFMVELVARYGPPLSITAAKGQKRPRRPQGAAAIGGDA